MCLLNRHYSFKKINHLISKIFYITFHIQKLMTRKKVQITPLEKIRINYIDETSDNPKKYVKILPNDTTISETTQILLKNDHSCYNIYVNNELITNLEETLDNFPQPILILFKKPQITRQEKIKFNFIDYTSEDCKKYLKVLPKKTTIYDTIQMIFKKDPSLYAIYIDDELITNFNETLDNFPEKFFIILDHPNAELINSKFYAHDGCIDISVHDCSDVKPKFLINKLSINENEDHYIIFNSAGEKFSIEYDRNSLRTGGKFYMIKYPKSLINSNPEKDFSSYYESINNFLKSNSKLQIELPRFKQLLSIIRVLNQDSKLKAKMAEAFQKNECHPADFLMNSSDKLYSLDFILSLFFIKKDDEDYIQLFRRIIEDKKCQLIQLINSKKSLFSADVKEGAIINLDKDHYYVFVNYSKDKSKCECFDVFENKNVTILNDQKDDKEGLNDSSIFIGDDNEKFHIIIDKIGEGATSVTLKIFDLVSERTMCKKILKVDMKKTFKDLQNAIKEFEFLYNVHHPCICTAYGINTSETIKNELNQEVTTVALFLEYLEYSLSDCLNKKILTNSMKARIVVEICHGMSHIHKLGWIHRDLKIENIMLSSLFKAKIVDFGLVRMNEYLSSSYSLTKSSMSKGVGTISYMSPEMMNEDPYDSSTDVYSFGIVLFFIFVGSLPDYKMRDKMKGNPIPLPKPSDSISEFCLSLIAKCASPNPSERPSFDDILDELRKNDYNLSSGIDIEFVKKRDIELQSSQ